jgi:hypothetical protein
VDSLWALTTVCFCAWFWLSAYSRVCARATDEYLALAVPVAMANTFLSFFGMHTQALCSSPRARACTLFYSVPVPAPLVFPPLWALYNLAFGLWWSMGDGRWATYIQRSPWAVARIFPMSAHAHRFCSHSRSRDAPPSFLSFCRACAVSGARMLSFFLLLPTASMCTTPGPQHQHQHRTTELFPLTLPVPVPVPRLFVFCLRLLFSSLSCWRRPWHSSMPSSGYIALSLLIPVPVANTLSTRMQSILFPFPYAFPFPRRFFCGRQVSWRTLTNS